jgi:uroporphyrinogen III methyltransferase/synthase
VRDENLAGKRCLLPQAAGAAPFLAGWLRGCGAVVDTVAMYRTVADEGARTALDDALLAGVDAVTFASPSAVKAFGLFVPGATAGLVACIGETTALAAREAGMNVDVVAPRATAEALVSGLAARFAGAEARA